MITQTYVVIFINLFFSKFSVYTPKVVPNSDRNLLIGNLQIVNFSYKVEVIKGKKQNKVFISKSP